MAKMAHFSDVPGVVRGPHPEAVLPSLLDIRPRAKAADDITPMAEAASLPANVSTETIQAAQEYAKASHASATQRAYAVQWRMFDEWCKTVRATSLPAAPETVALWCVDRVRAGASRSTVNKGIAAIGFVHNRSGLQNPAADQRVKDMVIGAFRKNTRQQKQKLPITPEQLRAMVAGLKARTAIGARDKAMLLVGFALAMRRSELVAIDIEHVRWDGGDAIVFVPRSKTDQQGMGAWVRLERGQNVETCPVLHLRAWIGALASIGVTGGPIFRPMTATGQLKPGRLSDKAVLRLVKDRLVAIGVDPEQYAGHSLRAGYVTAAAKAGVSYEDIRKVTRHAKLDTVARYDRQQGGAGKGTVSRIGL